MLYWCCTGDGVETSGGDEEHEQQLQSARKKKKKFGNKDDQEPDSDDEAFNDDIHFEMEFDKVYHNWRHLTPNWLELFAVPKRTQGKGC